MLHAACIRVRYAADLWELWLAANLLQYVLLGRFHVCTRAHRERSDAFRHRHSVDSAPCCGGAENLWSAPRRAPPPSLPRVPFSVSVRASCRRSGGYPRGRATRKHPADPLAEQELARALFRVELRPPHPRYLTPQFPQQLSSNSPMTVRDSVLCSSRAR